MAVLVREVMIKDPVTLKDTATIGEAVEVFAEKKSRLPANGRRSG